MNRIRRVQLISGAAGRLSVSTVEEAALLEFFAGACYALQRAFELGYRDRTGPKRSKDFVVEPARILKRLGSSTDLPDRAWLAGFYFNSALQRMASLNDRIPAVFPSSARDQLPDIRKEVNVLKHRVPSLPSKGRGIGSEQALRALGALRRWLAQCV